MRVARTIQASFAQALRSQGKLASVQGKGHLRRVFEWKDKYNGQIKATYSKSDCERTLLEIENGGEFIV